MSTSKNSETPTTRRWPYRRLTRLEHVLIYLIILFFAVMLFSLVPPYTITMVQFLAGYTGLWVLYNTAAWISMSGQTQVLTRKLIVWTAISVLPILALAILVLLGVR